MNTLAVRITNPTEKPWWVVIAHGQPHPGSYVLLPPGQSWVFEGPAPGAYFRVLKTKPRLRRPRG